MFMKNDFFRHQFAVEIIICILASILLGRQYVNIKSLTKGVRLIVSHETPVL